LTHQPSKAERLQQQGALNPRPESVLNQLFKEDPFFDARDLVQVRYEMLRLVEHEGKTVAESAAAFGFSRPVFYRTKAAYESEGLSGLLPRKRGPQGAHKLTPELLVFLRQCQEEDSSLKSAALASLLEKRYQVRLHPRTIERALAKAKKNTPIEP